MDAVYIGRRTGVVADKIKHHSFAATVLQQLLCDSQFVLTNFLEKEIHCTLVSPALLVHLHEVVQVLILLGHVGIDHEFALVSIDLLDAPFREGYDFVLDRQPVEDLQHEK